MYPPAPTKSRSDALRVSGRAYGITEDLTTHEITVNYDYNRNDSFMTLFEECYSQSNPGWQSLRGTTIDVGGPFFLFRHKKEYGLPDRSLFRQYIPFSNPNLQITEFAHGTLYPARADKLVYPPAINSDQGQMNQWGAEAVFKAAPGTSPMNLATSLGELKKDGIPSMIGSTFKRRAGIAKAAGDEYLNAQFGWQPLVNDVKSLAKTVMSSDEILNQLERDSGQVVRRRLTLQDGWEVISSENIGSASPNLSGIGTGLISSHFPDGELWRTVRRYRKVWFSGSFTYYLPPDYYSRNAVKRAAAQAKVLYGASLTPEVLWNLTPWSWAADWFSNADEVIVNTQRFLTEGLVMHHGYLMEHTIHEYLYTNRENTFSSTPVRLITETKGRVKANPFGFGLDWPDLSGYQVSILAALGMSRGG
jgi:hypothetical protein